MVKSNDIGKIRSRIWEVLRPKGFEKWGGSAWQKETEGINQQLILTADQRRAPGNLLVDLSLNFGSSIYRRAVYPDMPSFWDGYELTIPLSSCSNRETSWLISSKDLIEPVSKEISENLIQFGFPILERYSNIDTLLRGSLSNRYSKRSRELKEWEQAIYYGKPDPGPRPGISLEEMKRQQLEDLKSL